ncbi:beta-1,6-N-acetylglucosaminyltransferase [Kaistella montana]|uniref:Peptide O-xylosyltransferase n=1 Tax=Kaistella montana TaxID=1849733 RepID=A0ABW5KCY5_9FLAO|nr:beta-1,6-N-acetylglucosaminyltransferase [Kaistella montana]MCQ4036265.1 beta-1,6-N-acetylglucosaminyltransferase [Kaistella montana]
MKKKYLILSHKNPQQICRLINRLDDGSSQFFVHVDLKSDLKEFEILNSLKNTHIIPERENCIWGDFSIVKATLHLLENSIKSGNEGFTILLSGQDYPIKPNQFINQFLSEHSDFNFIEVVPIEEKWNKKMVRDKVEHYHFIHSEQKSDSNSYAPFHHTSLKEKARNIFHLIKGRMALKTFRELLVLPKRKPFFEKQFAGSQWWAFNEETSKSVHDFINKNIKELEDYYCYTSAADEIFFQSVIMHLAENNGKIKIKPSQTYVNWERKDVVLPVTFDDKDLQELSEAKHLWARKFDIEYNEKILDLIDEKPL